MEIVLFIDTCNKDMAIGLAKNDVLVYKKQYYAFKKQSEIAALEIKECLDKTSTKSSELTKIVVCNGPGSYTGIRIGLTLAKVMASALKIDLVTLSGLKILAGKNFNTLSLIDAKGDRSYVGFYNQGKALKEDQIMTISQVNSIKNDYNLAGDLSLIGLEDRNVDIIENMFLLSKSENRVANIDNVKAIYLKD